MRPGGADPGQGGPARLDGWRRHIAKSLRASALLAFAILALSSLPSHAAGRVVDDASLTAFVNQAGEQFVHDPHHVGLAIGIVFNGTRRSWGFGRTEKVGGHQPDERTLFEIGSVTKTYTGILLAQAVIDGKIHLDDPVQRYLDEPYPNLAYAGKPVRIVDLANHTAGLPKHIRTLPGNPSPRQVLDAYGDYSEAQFLKDLEQITLTAPPGTRFHYSNAGTQLIGIILERVYHQSYAELLRRFITGPRHMDDTVLSLTPEMRTCAAQGHDGQGQAMPELEFWRHIPAAGALYSSVRDQLTYLQWNLDATDPAVALSHRTTFTHTEERDDDIGLYWFVKPSPAGPLVIRHTGGSFGATSYIALYPQAHFGMVLLANDADGSTETALVKMGDALAAKLAGKHPRAPAGNAGLAMRMRCRPM